MSEFKLGKEYHYAVIEEFAENILCSMTEYGPDLYIGESFIVIKNDQKDKVCSFVMTKYGNGAYYKCIYNDALKIVS